MISIAQITRDYCFDATDAAIIRELIEKEVAAAVAAEREACAEICYSPEIHKLSYKLDNNTGKGYNIAMRDIAEAIRARK